MYSGYAALSLLSLAMIGCFSDDTTSVELGLDVNFEDDSRPVPEVVPLPAVHMTVEPMRTDDVSEGDVEVVDLALQFEGVGRVHRGYFRDPESLQEVGRTLVGVISPPANVHISASGALGGITAVVRTSDLDGPVMTVDGKIDLSLLTPITVSMAGYRELVSGKFDFRVQSFDVSVSVISDTSWCTFTATGQHPPTGAQLSQCLDVDGDEVCGVVTGSFLQLTAVDTERVSACLR